jgi:hypothetical protein
LFIGQVKGDGEPTCFDNVGNTGIPALQEWTKTLTVSSRQRSARAFLTQLRIFVGSVKTYVEGNGGVTSGDRAMLRAKWQSSSSTDSHATLKPREGSPDPFAELLGGNGTLYKMEEQTRMDGIAPRLAKV